MELKTIALTKEGKRQTVVCNGEESKWLRNFCPSLANRVSTLV